MKKLIIFYIIFGTTCLSCKTETTIKAEETYNRVSNEFIDQLLEFGDFDCSCIIEPTYTLLDYQKIETSEDMKSHIMRIANLKSHLVTDSLNNLSRQVNLNKTIINRGYRLIQKKQADSIAMLKSRKEKQRAIDSLCPKSFMTLTKPFFNKTMDTVFIIANDMPYSCFSSITSSFHYINGEWIIPIKL